MPAFNIPDPDKKAVSDKILINYSVPIFCLAGFLLNYAVGT